MSRFYSLARSVCGSVLKLYNHKTVGASGIPAGGALLAANHESFLDSICVGVSCPYDLNWLADSWLFKVPGLAWVLPRLNAYPISFSSEGYHSVGSLIRSRSILRKGGKVLIYPEGRRRADGEFGPLFDGAARLAVAAQVPIVPVLISGTGAIWPPERRFPRLRGQTQVTFGSPIETKGRKQEHAPSLTMQLRDELQRLKNTQTL